MTFAATLNVEGPVLQVVAKMIEEHLGAKVYARRYAPGGDEMICSSWQ